MISEDKKHKVLVVEDNASLLKMFKYFLINEHLEVFTAPNGLKAIEILKTTPNISVIVSDYKLPGINGIELMEKAKQMVPLATRIVMSAYRDENILYDAINIGEVYRFLSKPIDFASFKNCVESAIAFFEEKEKKENELKLKNVKIKKLLNCLSTSNDEEIQNNLISNIYSENNDDDIAINLFEMAISLSNALDLIIPSLYNHHKQVCYISTIIAEEMDCSFSEYRNIFLASILHDIGAVALSEGCDLKDFDIQHCHEHGDIGAKFFNIFTPLNDSADLVKFHHVNWDNGKGNLLGGCQVKLGSHIIHLADRVSVLIDPNEQIFGQIPVIYEKLKMNVGSKFHPEVYKAFIKASEKESFWLDLSSPFLQNVLKEKFQNHTIKLDMAGLLEFSKFYSSIIDSRSNFTANHSCGVATTGEILAKKMNLPEKYCSKIKIAGYLHDLGKLVVPKNILEKPGHLSDKEWDIVKTHTYYTYRLIKNVTGMNEIAEIASFHHETLNGTGYPFHLNSDFLSVGAKIIAVSDVFTALAEDRPYRNGMSKIKEIVTNMVREKKLESNVVETLFSHFDEIYSIRKSAQEAHFESLNILVKEEN
jgi:response regulator RpfG family c-di-GMP phosphodiesterase